MRPQHGNYFYDQIFLLDLRAEHFYSEYYKTNFPYLERKKPVSNKGKIAHEKQQRLNSGQLLSS